MELGLYTAEIFRPNLKALMKAVREYGFTQMQLDLSSLCGETMPEQIDRVWAQQVAEEACRLIDDMASPWL